MSGIGRARRSRTGRCPFARGRRPGNEPRRDRGKDRIPKYNRPRAAADGGEKRAEAGANRVGQTAPESTPFVLTSSRLAFSPQSSDIHRSAVGQSASILADLRNSGFSGVPSGQSHRAQAHHRPIRRGPAGDSKLEVGRDQRRQTGVNRASAKENAHYANDTE